jgi:hypothetical protein
VHAKSFGEATDLQPEECGVLQTMQGTTAEDSADILYQDGYFRDEMDGLRLSDSRCEPLRLIRVNAQRLTI